MSNGREYRHALVVTVDDYGDNYHITDESGGVVARVSRWRAGAMDHALAFAASPNMLSALKLALDALGPDPEDSTVCVIKNAIAKAEGMVRLEPGRLAKGEMTQ